MTYDHHVNGWELIDTDSMRYWKETDQGTILFIDMTWMDLTREDPEYGTGREYVVCASEEETTDLDEAEEAFADHHVDAYAINEIISREDAEKIILNYIQSH